MRNFLILIIIASFLSTISAQTVNIVLKNSKVVIGEIVQESPEFVIITNDTGELKVSRLLIESITYKSSEQTEIEGNIVVKSKNRFSDNIAMSDKVVLDDLVLIFLKNEDVVSGRLVAKSLDVIIVQTESGSLTIPKREIDKIEYLSSEFSERGEVVIAHLANQTYFEGNIYFEDANNLILDTKIGRLTIDKKNLRSIEYTGETGQGDETLLTEFASARQVSGGGLPAVQKRLDMISLGYSPSFGAEYGTGLGLNYSSKFLLSQLDGFYISAIGGLNFNYFTLNKDNFKNENPTVSASGGTLISTIIAGAAFTLYQQASSKYEFYIAPQLEANIIYKSLTKEYPSFPAFDSKVSTTEFVFGIRNKIGFDMLFDDMKVGVSYDSHFLFGDEDYNTISLNFTKKLF